MHPHSLPPILMVAMAGFIGSCQPSRDDLTGNGQDRESESTAVPTPDSEQEAIWQGSEVESADPVEPAVASSAEVDANSVPEAGSPTLDQGADALTNVCQATTPSAVLPGPAGTCSEDMALVDGDFCPSVDEPCLNWMEDPAKFPYARCAEFQSPSVCKAERVHLRFCMDRLEAADDSAMPIGDISWTNASATCRSRGKRLCQEREWVFACEGEEIRPYPYGYVRNPSLCNFEKENLVDRGELADYRQPVTSNPHCLSPFGIQNMVGNIDEWVVLDKPHWATGGRKMMSGLKGGWWGPLRNRCRPVTVDHDEYFHELQTGFRCCADAESVSTEQPVK